jgi:AAA domain
MRLYGEANNVRGLATGPIETRFARLLQNTAADSLVVWTTPARWAAGEGLSLRFPQLHLEFTCSLGEGHLVATRVAQVPEDARSPDREPGAVGVVVHAERIPLPPDDAPDGEADPGVDTLEQHFARLAGRRWGGFAAPLRAALEAEAREDEARTQRLTVPFKEATLSHGGEEDVWRLKGVPIEALRAFDDGEWLEVMDDQGRSRTSARVIDTHPSAGNMIVGVRAASDPPRSGFVRPRSRRKILEQKRALLEELASPTGSLPNLVRLVAAPASMPAPRSVRPARFVNPAVVRNRSQSRAVALALGLEDGQALLLQGPPGTGKSTTAAEIDVQLILRDPGVRILVCSHSNHGTDNMLMKVLPFLDDAAERIARIGFYERVAKEARPFFATPDADLGDRNIIFTTIDALVLQDVAGARVYDYVIVDEANRAGVLDSLLALARGRRMIMVGDPMQLQPVMSEAEQQMVAANGNGNGGRRGRRGGRPALVGVAQPGAQNVIGKSLFAWIQERRFAPAATVLLDQQNRMHPAIGELVSRVFYASRVRTGPAAPRRGTGLPMFPSPVTWVDTRSLRGNVESRAGGTSLFNVAEARLVTSITRYLASQAPPNLTIGVITAYAEQRDLLRRLMGPHDWPTERQLEIDTVDAFEGREKDIIVLSLVRANRRRDIGFLRLEQRLNVAVSRSRRLIILVGDTSTLRGGYFNHLVSTAQQVGHIVPAPKLIGQMLHRGRRPQREERRHDGLPEPEGVPTPYIDEAAAEAGVAPIGAPSHEGALPTGARRRRRRAWERRRERLRMQHEQQRAGEYDEGAPPEGADQPAPTELGDQTTAEPLQRARRRRRRRGERGQFDETEVQPELDAQAQSDFAPESAAGAAAEAPPPAPASARPRRRRVAATEPVADEPVQPPMVVPARGRKRRTGVSETTAEIATPPSFEPVAAPTPDLATPRARRKPTAAHAPAPLTPAPAQASAPDIPRAPRRRVASATAPAPSQPAPEPELSAPPVRRRSTKAHALPEAAPAGAAPAPLVTDASTPTRRRATTKATKSAPQPAPAPEIAPAPRRRTSARPAAADSTAQPEPAPYTNAPAAPETPARARAVRRRLQPLPETEVQPERPEANGVVQPEAAEATEASSARPPGARRSRSRAASAD